MTGLGHAIRINIEVIITIMIGIKIWKVIDNIRE